MQQPSDEIKARLDIVDVLREYIPLKPAGVNFRALCPFHREKSPSFVVSPEKQIWHCFGCQKSGDIFSFIMEMEGVNFVEALRILAPKAGVTLKRQNPKITSQRNRLLDILEFSRKYYHRVLIDSPYAKNARSYLKNRGLTEDTIEEWQIGFSLDSWDDLLNSLKAKGFKENEIFLSGMCVKKNGMNKFYNRFRYRIMFPVNDVNANTVAFSARVSPEREAEEKMGKYINSPQTMIYDKSRILFGLDKARFEIKKNDLAIIAEGQMDVITSHQHNFINTIASSGTALTIDQVKLLQRYTNNFIFALDSDSAGQLAIERGESVAQNVDYQEIEVENAYGKIKKYINPLLSYNINMKVIEIPSGKDPDECIKNNHDEWKMAIKNAKPIMQYHFDRIFKDLDIENIENKRNAVKKILPIIVNISNIIEVDYWLKKLSEKINIQENILREILRDLKKSIKKNKPEEQEIRNEVEIIEQKREYALSEALLALMFKFVKLINYVPGALTIDQILGLENKYIYKNLIIYYNNSNSIDKENNFLSIDYKSFKKWIKQESSSDLLESRFKILDKLVILADKDYHDKNQEQAKQEVIKIIIELKKFYFNSRKKEIEKLIFKAEKDCDEEKSKSLIVDLKILSDEIMLLK